MSAGTGRGRRFGLAGLALLAWGGVGPLRLVNSDGGVAIAEPTTVAPKSVLPFIEDDFAAAKRRAQESRRLLFVDTWAPWCHTCLSMRNLVFPDPLLQPLADRFVYLAIDTELPRNAAFVERFPVRSLPMILVIDPSRGDAVVARFTGAMTAPDLRARLEDLLRTQPVPADVLLSQADAAAAIPDTTKAATLYAQAASSQPSPATLARARLGQIQALREGGDYRVCAELADLSHTDVGRSAAATDFFSYGADCASRLTDADLRQRLRRQLRGHLEAVVRDPAAPLLPDDRSDGYGTLIDLADGLGDSAGGDRYAQDRLTLLETAAAQAKNPVAAATYDAHRLECYRRLKRYAPAETMLLASARQMPHDYNPPARLARLYLDMGRLDEGLKSIDRALSLAQGPRRISMLELRASLLHGLGQTAAAISALDAAIQLLTPKAGAPAMLVRGAEARIAGLRKTQETLRGASSPPARAGAKAGSKPAAGAETTR
jgi:thioredoxin-like negative regulator of GroEL